MTNWLKLAEPRPDDSWGTIEWRRYRDGRVYITRADSKILVTAELMMWLPLSGHLVTFNVNHVYRVTHWFAEAKCFGLERVGW